MSRVDFGLLPSGKYLEACFGFVCGCGFVFSIENERRLLLSKIPRWREASVDRQGEGLPRGCFIRGTAQAPALRVSNDLRIALWGEVDLGEL